MVEYDKRRHRRLNAAGPIAIVRSSGQQVEAQAIDVSLLGCRVISLARLDLGEQISTTLCFPTGGSYRIEGTIKSVSGSAPYSYGVAFDTQTIERLFRDAFKLI